MLFARSRIRIGSAGSGLTVELQTERHSYEKCQYEEFKKQTMKALSRLHFLISVVLQKNTHAGALALNT